MAKQQKSQKNQSKRIRPSGKKAPALEQLKKKEREWKAQADPTFAIRETLKDVKKALIKAEAMLCRAVKEKGDVQEAFNKRTSLLKKRGQLIRQLNNN